MEEIEKTLKELSSLKRKLESSESIQDRIQFLVDSAGNPNAFAKQVGMSVSGLKRYLTGGEPTASKIMQISEKTGINAGWILTGRGKIYDDENHKFIDNDRAVALLSRRDDFIEALDKMSSVSVDGIKDRYYRLKDVFSTCSETTKTILINSNITDSKKVTDEQFEVLLSDLKSSYLKDFALIPGYKIQVSAGHGSLSQDQLEPTRYLAFRRKWLKWRGFTEKDLAIVWAKGDSMEPTIHNNDTLVVHTGRNIPADGHIYIFRNGDELFVKRYQSALGSWRMISDNPMYETVSIPKEEQHQFEVVGQVVHIAKDIGD